MTSRTPSSASARSGSGSASNRDRAGWLACCRRSRGYQLPVHSCSVSSFQLLGGLARFASQPSFFAGYRLRVTGNRRPVTGYCPPSAASNCVAACVLLRRRRALRDHAAIRFNRLLPIPTLLVGDPEIQAGLDEARRAGQRLLEPADGVGRTVLLHQQDAHAVGGIGRAWIALEGIAVGLLGEQYADEARIASDGIPAYASSGMLLPAMERAESALRLREEGFRALKIRVDPRRLDEGLDAVTATRAAVGDTMAIMVDLNQGWRMAGDTAPALDPVAARTDRRRGWPSSTSCGWRSRSPAPTCAGWPRCAPRPRACASRVAR